MSSVSHISFNLPGIGTMVNVVAIILGGALGLVLKKFLSSNITDTLMQGVGLSVLVIGLSGIFSSSGVVLNNTLSFNYTLLMILSLVFGALIGSLLKIQQRLESISERLSSKFSLTDSHGFAEGFLSSSLLFCVGAMAIVGSLEDGLNMNPQILFSKSILDFISAMILAGTYGIGVLLSAISVGIYQGLITVLAYILSPLLTPEVISQMSLIGSVLVVGMSFDMLKLTNKLKISNLLPSIFIPLIYYSFRLLANS